MKKHLLKNLFLGFDVTDLQFSVVIKPYRVRYYEWTYMYGLNNAFNRVLALVDAIPFSGDATTQKNVIKAWTYWWKGFAYAKIGSLYDAGIITNKASALVPNPNYVNSAAVIAKSNKNLDTAATLLNRITNTSYYTTALGKLIPAFAQVKGQVPIPAMWVYNINTLKAHNLLVNKKVAQNTTGSRVVNTHATINYKSLVIEVFRQMSL